MFHLTTEPLLEEYTIARATWGFSMTDMCEMARNSVLQSDFPDDWKRSWIGAGCLADGELRNDPALSNVPTIREGFRWDVLQRERAFVRGVVDDGTSRDDPRL